MIINILAFNSKKNNSTTRQKNTVTNILLKVMSFLIKWVYYMLTTGDKASDNKNDVLTILKMIKYSYGLSLNVLKGHIS